MPVLEYTEKIQDQVLDAVKAGQDAIVDVVQQVVDVLPAPPPLPFLDQLPPPGEVIDRAFGYAERLLDAQREFAVKLAGVTKSAAQSAAKPAAKTTAKASA